MADYGYGTKLEGVSFDDAIIKVTEALKKEGFGVLTEIDMQATLKKKIGVDMERYVILGACNPKLAHQAVVADPEIGLLLPCNAIVREVEGGVAVSIVSPRAMFGLAGGGGELAGLVDDADGRIRRAVDAL